MIGRVEFDLGVERVNYPYKVALFASFYVGDCDGFITIQLNNTSASKLNPKEFGRLNNIKRTNYLYLNNTAQPGKTLVLYFKEARRLWL